MNTCSFKSVQGLWDGDEKRGGEKNHTQRAKHLLLLPVGNWMGDPQLASDRAMGGSVISQAGFELCRSGPGGYLHGPGGSEAEREAFDFCSLSTALSVTSRLGGFQQSD